MKKIGIIGGGLSGLTCGYRLAQKGAKVIVFEKEPGAGGRIQYAAAIGSEKFQTNLMELVKDLDLEEMKIVLKQKEIGFFGDDFLALEDFPQVLQKTLGPEKLKTFTEFSQFVNSLNFDPISPSKELLDLRSVSLAEYGEKFPEEVKSMALVAARILSGEDDLSKIGADYGLHLIRMGNEVMSGEAICFEEVNLMSLTNVLSKKIEEKEGEVLCGRQVKRVIKKNGGFEILHERLGEEGTEMVDMVVFALPLVYIPEIFPELKLKTNIQYPKNKIVIAEGELKYPSRKLLMGLPDNPYNLRLFLNFIPTEQYFLPWNKDKEINLDFLYEDYEVTLEKEIFPLPWLPPNAQVPELKTETEGVFLVGDFYYYPYDTAGHTGKVVAELIKL